MGIEHLTRPTKKEVEHARLILDVEAQFIKHEKGVLVDPGVCKVQLRAHAVSYCLPCFGIELTVGLRVGYCEWMNASFDGVIPDQVPRFVLGMVTHIIPDKKPDLDYVEITFDAPPKGFAKSIGTSRQELEKFCIPVKYVNGQWIFSH